MTGQFQSTEDLHGIVNDVIGDIEQLVDGGTEPGQEQAIVLDLDAAVEIAVPGCDYELTNIMGDAVFERLVDPGNHRADACSGLIEDWIGFGIKLQLANLNLLAACGLQAVEIGAVLGTVRVQQIDIPADDVRIRDLPPLPAGTEQESVEVLIRVRDKPAGRA